MRTKIFLPYLVGTLVLGAVSYLYLDHALSAAADERTSKRLHVLARLFERSEALRGYEQLAEVRHLSMSRQVVDAFRPISLPQKEGESAEEYDARLRQEWFVRTVRAVESAVAVLQQKGRTPALVFLTDRNGVVLARNTTPNACPAGKNVAQAVDVVQRALDGEASFSLWSLDTSPFSRDSKAKGHLCSLMNTGLLEVSAAPIWGTDDDVAGALVVGYEVSNGTAAEKSDALGIALAVLHGGKVYSSSFGTDTARQQLETALNDKERKALWQKAFASGTETPTFSLEVEGKPYLAVAAPVSNSRKSDAIGYVFMASLEDTHFFSSALWVLMLFFGIAAVVVIVIGVLLGNYFMKPVVAIEEGLLKIINGEYNYRFDVESDEVGGLSYRINQLVNVLTGQEESSDEE